VDERIRRIVFSQPIPERLIRNIGRVDRQDRMTPRRWETLKLVAQGLSNREIAAIRGVSYDTVRKDVRALYSRLEVPNRTALVAKVYREGIL